MVDPLLDPSGFGPSERVFAADGVVIEVEASSSPSLQSGERKGLGDREREAFDEAERSLPLAPSLASERGGIRFLANGANASGVVTELLAQPPMNARRRGHVDKYASLERVALRPEEPEAEDSGTVVLKAEK